MKVIKRDGSLVDFNPDKIFTAISKANKELGENEIAEELIRKITTQVVSSIDFNKDNSVEDIQVLVINTIAKNGEYDLMRIYTEYRYKRSLVRESRATDDSILTLIRGTNKFLNEENSNKSTILVSTQRDYMAGEVSKDLCKRIIIPPDIMKAHEEGVLHFHDMDYFVSPAFNCCNINIGDMLDNGTVMNGRMIESPHTFRVACTITTQIIAAVASNQYGGQSVNTSRLGKYLRRSKERFEKKVSKYNMSEGEQQALIDEMVKEELSAGIQTIQYQINTLMTTNGQAPFVTLWMYLKDDDEYIEENAMIIEEILKQRLEGLKNEAGVLTTPAFPKLIYVLDENNIHGGKYEYLTDLATKCTAKRMYPDYVSAKKMRDNKDGTVAQIMGCRSSLAPWKDENGNYKYEGRLTKKVEPSLNHVNELITRCKLFYRITC